jgi:hypothetical protein
MMTVAPGGCPDEANVPTGAPGAISDSETVVRGVVLSAHLLDQNGTLILTPAAIREDDLAARKGRSVSVLREPHTSPQETTRRALALNQQQEWQGDPVVARARVAELRKLLDNTNSWRLVCVNADPTTAALDSLGACPTHGSIVRSDPKPNVKDRLSWFAARIAVATAFNLVSHASGGPVTPIP